MSMQNYKGERHDRSMYPHTPPESDAPVRYDTHAIDYDASGEAKALNIVLNGRLFHLPRLDVGPAGDHWDTIFYLNISQEYDPLLYEEAAAWFAQKFMQDGVDIVITPPSTKSAVCLSRAVEKANELLAIDAAATASKPHVIRHIPLLGGKYISDVVGADRDLTDFYFPITTPEGKYMGMSKRDAQYLHERFIDRGSDDSAQARTARIALADDVLSTGKTLEAMRGIVRKATYGKANPHVYVLARESVEPFAPLPRDTTAAMYIVEIAGGISPMRLSSV